MDSFVLTKTNFMHYSKTKKSLLVASFFLSMFWLSSCGENPSENTNSKETLMAKGAEMQDPVKCIDNKPAPTPFSDTVNGLNHDIPLQQALDMTNRYNQMHENILLPEFRGKKVMPLTETFNLKAIDEILCQPNTVAFRTYLGMDSGNKVRVIFVGVNPNGEDIIGSGGTITDNPRIAEAGNRFP